MADSDPGELSDDLPPLVDEDGNEIPLDRGAAAQPAENEPGPPEPRAAADATQAADETFQRPDIDVDGPSEEADEAVLRVAAGLRAAALGAAVDEEPLSAADAVKSLMNLADDPDGSAKPLDQVTNRLLGGLSSDDFEECEDAILQGADVNADCGAGMHPIHVAAIRGGLLLTELLLAHGAHVNQRDMNGNTPLLYACHFFRQHGQGPQITAQLLHHRADPLYRIKEGKFAEKSAVDLVDKACKEPSMDENAPRHMRAMLLLAVDGSDGSRSAITRMWMEYKSQNRKLFQVSGKKDKYDYGMQSIDWVLPANAKNAQDIAPVKIASTDAIDFEERFTLLTDYSFSDEGANVKVYVSFPQDAVAALGHKDALTVDFDFQAFDLQLRAGPAERFRLRIEPLFGSIEVGKSKYRASPASKRVTLTLCKRHPNRTWSSLQKAR